MKKLILPWYSSGENSFFSLISTVYICLSIKLINFTAKELGIVIQWKGRGINEKGYWNNKCIIEIDKEYFRPTEVNSLKGDSSKARKLLGWKPNTNIKSLIKEMIEFENSY
jgi:GDP-D-mannose dehydratase